MVLDIALVLGGFLGGCLFMAFANRLANSLADELHRLGNRLQRN